MTIVRITKKNYKSYLIVRKLLLVLFTMMILTVNFTIGVSSEASVSAAGAENEINITNLLREHNLERIRNNLKPLRLNNNLVASANEKANIMVVSQCWSHYCPENTPPWQYIENHGYDYRLAGENLAEGFFDVEVVMRAWLNSETHKENILKPEYEEIGFGIVRGNFKGLEDNLIVVVHFGTQDPTVLVNTSTLEIVLTEPEEGAFFTVNEVGVSGQTSRIEEVEIYDNGELMTQLAVEGSIFSGLIDSLGEGEHTIYAEGVNENGDTVTSNEVNYVIDTSLVSGIDDEITEASSFINISRNSKNAINIGFLVILTLLFFIDFWFIRHVDILQKNFSMSHLSGVIFFFSIILLATGSINGSLIDGVAI